MPRPYRTISVVPSLPPRLKPLLEIANNLWWSWNRDAVDLFRRLDADLFEELRHNPVAMLGRISQARLDDLREDEGFLSHMDRVYRDLLAYVSVEPHWDEPDLSPQGCSGAVAYFSMEYGLSEALPIYSGGLGVLSGDHLKTASDMAMPMVGVGLLYQEGYFRQYLSADGWQQETYPANDFHNMPVTLERDEQGVPVTVRVSLSGRDVVAQIWRIQVGRVPLYMLDSSVEENSPEDRPITSKLYSGDLDMRIRQEMLLGIGGLRALSALGIDPAVCHMNEGHSAFLGLERIRLAMQRHGIDFETARTLASAGSVFTTHTPVPAGIDLFPPYLIDRYFGQMMQELGIGREEFLSLGRSADASPETPFSMAVLALSLSASANGVSQLHGQVARQMWQSLWPGTPVGEVPITAVTNGVHHRSWVSEDMATLLLRHLGPRWLENPADSELWQRVERIPDDELWLAHRRRRERLVTMARQTVARQMRRRGASQSDVDQVGEVLDADVLTIGFARRFATYKRALLLFRDPERLSRILNAPGRPVQIIFAGKAHPEDTPAKDLIRSLIHTIRRPDLVHRIVFLEDYDMAVARYLVQGADVWLNTPRWGQEASGTSGMKACMNGAIHLSSFDGWWYEGYSPEIGWRIGSGEVYEDENFGDQVEAEALYDLLEKDIVPLFYDHGSNGIPHSWVARMKRSMAAVGPRFNTQRMLYQYADSMYCPAIRRHARLGEHEAAGAISLTEWVRRLRAAWPQVRFTDIHSEAQDGISVRQELVFGCVVYLGALDPADVVVQVCLGRADAAGEITDYHIVDMVHSGTEDDGNHVYKANAQFDTSGLSGYTMRILPRHPDVLGAQLPGLVRWADEGV
ncbi:MAG: glycosyltransferase family 1 protein [Chloroflexi bacterium]|nr:glycosyltransferase family 1 protein [Chloroflexota bacterium]